jgi:hypothetical protein
MTNKAIGYEKLQKIVEEFLYEPNNHVSMQIVFENPRSAKNFRLRLDRKLLNWQGCYHYIQRANVIHIEKEDAYFD